MKFLILLLLASPVFAGTHIQCGDDFDVFQGTATNFNAQVYVLNTPTVSVQGVGISTVSAQQLGTWNINASQAGSWTTTVTQPVPANLKSSVLIDGSSNTVQAQQAGTWNVNSTVVNVPTITVNGTVPVSGSFTFATSSMAVYGVDASGSSNTGKPVKVGGVGYTSEPSTITANGQVKDLYMGRDGAAVTNDECPADLIITSTVTLTTTTETVLLSSGSAGVKHDALLIWGVNSSTTPVKIYVTSVGGPTGQPWDFPILVPGEDQRGWSARRWPQKAYASNWTVRLSVNVTDVIVVGMFCKTK